jgi:hypothetical protein
MSKLAILVATFALAGCASTSEWRTLTIDGSSEAAFEESISLFDQELPKTRNRMFALALVDIVRTGAEESGQTKDGSPAYTDEQLRSDLHGLTYDGVIAFADETGPSVRQLYYSGSGARLAGSAGSSAFSAQNRAAFTADGIPLSDYRPGGQFWPTGADARGRAEYQNHE